MAKQIFVKRPTKTFTEDITRIKYEAERFIAGGTFDLYEDERFISTVDPLCCDMALTYGKAVFSCWGEGWSHAWRIIACEIIEDNLRFHCARQMGRVTCTLDCRRNEAQGAASQSRLAFLQKIAALIEMNFVGITVNHLVTARDDSRHLSGVPIRLQLEEQGRTIAAIAISNCEPQTHIDAALSAGLTWVDALRVSGRTVTRLMLIVPKGRAFTIACRLVYLQPEALNIGLYEIDELKRSIKPVAAFAQADLMDNLKRATRQAKWPREKSPSGNLQNFLDELNRLVANTIDTRERSGWLYLSIRGLTFARVSTRQLKVEFGLQAPRKRLTTENRRELEELALTINDRRTANGKVRTDETFCPYAERWLEAMIRKQVSVIDPTLDSRFVYSQVPAYRGEQRSFIDLLTVTRDCRLVVMELKVSEDAEFVYQGLDYWIRIDWHRKRGDFERRGYFNGLKLLDAPPLLYLVAPLFRFHATTKLLARAISIQVPVYRIGINEEWRSGVRVLLSERLNI